MKIPGKYIKKKKIERIKEKRRLDFSKRRRKKMLNNL